MADPVVEFTDHEPARRYVLVIQDEGGYRADDAELEALCSSKPPMIHTVVMEHDYLELERDSEELREQLEQAARRVTELEGERSIMHSEYIVVGSPDFIDHAPWPNEIAYARAFARRHKGLLKRRPVGRWEEMDDYRESPSSQQEV